MRGRKAKLTDEIFEKIKKEFVFPLGSGKFLPSITHIMRHYDISRNTVNSVISKLEEMNLAVRMPMGKTLVTLQGSHVKRWENDWGKQVALWPKNHHDWIINSCSRQIIQGMLRDLKNTSLDLNINIRDWNILGGDNPMDHFSSPETIGVIILDQHQPKFMQGIMDINKPMVAVDFDATPWNIDSFRFDDFGAGEILARRLIKLGHERLMLVREAPEKEVEKTDHAWTERAKGFLHELQLQNAAPPMELHLHKRDPEACNSLIPQLQRMLQMPIESRPTAIYIPGDYFLPVITEACKNSGLRIPKHLTVVGVEEINTHSTVTGVRFRGHNLGQHAIRQLLKLMQDPKWKTRPRTLVRTKGYYTAGKTHARANS